MLQTKSKKLGILTLMFLGFQMLIMVSPVSATATLEVTNKTTFGDGTVGVKVNSISGGIAYALAKNTVFVYNWTAGSTETERIFYEKVATSSSMTVFTLYEATVLVDTFTITRVDPEVFVPTDLLITLGLLFVVLFIIAAIIKGLMSRG